MSTSEKSISNSEETEKPTSDNTSAEDLDDNNSNTETDFEMQVLPNRTTETNLLNLIRRRDIGRGCFTRFAEQMDQVMKKRSWWIFYFIIITINIFLIVWLFTKPKETTTPFFICCDLFVNGFLLFEVTIRWKVQKKAYLKKCSNLVDLLVLFLCLTALCLFTLKETVFRELEEVTSIVLRIVRDCSQILRIILLIKNQKDSYQHSKMRIQFNTDDDDENNDIKGLLSSHNTENFDSDNSNED
ncbi:hypothetical protein M0813_01109 [Anaeramoeba flamelloides]|uniref:Ion transport domain-containing protein n=1 Tax=Anaeramoeba flamelloides TaxID=1746091 RepID=A0AAV7Z9W8_9EUKA|nr:hypothetical protein M0812_18537 [Anaeramoeba flamelloides]KAJ6226140.1 hypothetical protein M0813_01109 [Anaeramoeba flamelloides]